MAGRGSETGSGNEAHRAPGESGQAEGSGYEQPAIDQAKGAAGDDVRRMEEKLAREGKLEKKPLWPADDRKDWAGKDEAER